MMECCLTKYCMRLHKDHLSNFISVFSKKIKNHIQLSLQALYIVQKQNVTKFPKPLNPLIHILLKSITSKFKQQRKDLKIGKNPKILLSLHNNQTQ